VSVPEVERPALVGLVDELARCLGRMRGAVDSYSLQRACDLVKAVDVIASTTAAEHYCAGCSVELALAKVDRRARELARQLGEKP
jgi:hypothetical protein